MINTGYDLALPPGTRIEEYQIVSVLGQGSFGITYLTEDTNLGTQLAIKEYLPGDWAFRDTTQTVRPKSTSVSESFERGQEAFLKEARLLARVMHPNIVRVRRFFRAHGTAYIAMDFIKGQSLGDTLNQDYRTGGYPSAALKRVLLSILEGLGALHSAGIIHRDIKPGNIVIEPSGNPILVDFGAARNFDRAAAQGMTVIVTPGYAPIEQYSDDGEQGPFTDIYALGALAYRAITGQPPDAPYKRLGRNSWVPASVAGAGKYPGSVLAAIDWALAVQPQDRPQSASALLARLRESPDDEPVFPIEEPTRLLSEATQIIEKSRWRSASQAPTEPAPAPEPEQHGAALSSGEVQAAAPPNVTDLAGRSRKLIPIVAASVAVMALVGGAVAYFVVPEASRAPAVTTADQDEQLRAAEAARKAAEEKAAIATKREAEQRAAEAQRQEQERQASEARQKSELEAAEAAHKEAERQAAAKAEADRQAALAAKQKADMEAAETARREGERQAEAKAEADRQAALAAKQKADQEAAEAARQEAARQASAKAEADRQAAVAAKLKADQAAAEAARQRAERQAAAKQEADRQASAKKAKADPVEKSNSRLADARCTTILQTTQLMGALSDEDKAYLRDHCH